MLKYGMLEIHTKNSNIVSNSYTSQRIKKTITQKAK